MINQAICASFKKELFEGVHNFNVAPDIFMIALFTAAGRLDSATTVYSPVGEAEGPHYTAGGEILSIVMKPTIQGKRIMVNFDEVRWPIGIAVTARGALIYNSTKANRAVLVVDFGLDIQTAHSGKFGVKFPYNSLDLNPAAIVVT